MSLYKYLYIALGALFFIQCSKNDPAPSTTGTNPGTGTGSGPGSGPGSGSGSGTTPIHLFKPANSFTIYYGNNVKPYHINATGFTGEDVVKLDSMTQTGALRIAIHNINAGNATLSEIGSNKFLHPTNVSTATSATQFYGTSDTAGKVYLTISRVDGQSMTVTGQTSPVASIIEPLVSISPNIVGDACFVAKQPVFILSDMTTVFTTPGNQYHPGQQTYKLQ